MACLLCRVYERERKKIKAKAIDSNTTALDEGKAEEEVSIPFLTADSALHMQLPLCKFVEQLNRALQLPNDLHAMCARPS